MRKISFRSLSYIFLVLLVFLFAQPALAHGDEPRLEISVERINPGGLVEVRGVDFDYEEQVALSLIHLKIQIPLTEVTTDVEGVFTQNVVLPADLSEGEYNFLATTDHHMVTSPTIIVWGVAAQNQEDNGIRDQSDVQLEPLPDPVLGASTTVPQVPVPLKSTPSENSSSPFVWIVAAIGIIVVLSLALKGRR